jgi:hypothetical protein
LTLFPRRAQDSREGQEGGTIRQRSLALPKILEPLASGAADFTVLDLGRASPANLDFFLGRGARLTVADFSPSRPEALSELVRFEAGTCFDLVLAWDFLNYLSPAKLGLLLSNLEPFFRPGTSIHAFVATSREMPSAPRRYRIEGPEMLHWESASERVIPSPRYAEQDLLKSMPGLVVERRFQLRSGALEYLFSYRKRLRVAYSAAMDEAPRSLSGSASRWRQAPSR